MKGGVMGNLWWKWWILVGKKVVETAISVKVLTITALMIVSTVLVWHGKVSGGEWAAVNGGVISTVYALREGFKIARLKKNGGQDREKEMV